MSYALSEHVLDYPAIAIWEQPAESLFLLEVRGRGASNLPGNSADTDIDCGQTNEIWFQHAGGTNILWMDGHVKWLKPTVVGQATGSTRPAARTAIITRSVRGRRGA
jgi:prepilin-type processing-associated H-X9-DG protein